MWSQMTINCSLSPTHVVSFNNLKIGEKSNEIYMMNMSKYKSMLCTKRKILLSLGDDLLKVEIIIRSY